MTNHSISTSTLSLQQTMAIVEEGLNIELSNPVKIKIKECRDYLDQKIKNTQSQFTASILVSDHYIKNTYRIKN